jgi:hypothetical protein
MDRRSTPQCRQRSSAPAVRRQGDARASVTRHTVTHVLCPMDHSSRQKACEPLHSVREYIAVCGFDSLGYELMSSLSISSIPNAVQSAELGIRRGLAGIDQDARVVANGMSGSVDAVADALVDSLQQRLLVEASAQMLSTADQTLGALIDVKA